MNQNALQETLNNFAASCEAKIGLSAEHLQSQFSVSLNDSDYFLIASTFKLPLAICCLQKVENGELRLERMIEIEPGHARMGSGILSYSFDLPGISVSLRNLIRLMIEVSDNAAADIVLDLCGGPEKLTRWLKEIGIEEMEISSTCLDALNAYFGEFATADSFDLTTPRAMAVLLKKLKTENLLKEDSLQFLQTCMSHCTTGLNRIRKLLPKGTFVAEKTGTLGDLVADAALVELPQNKGDLILSFYVHSESMNLSEKEEIIAKLSKLIFESVSASS